VINWYVIGKAKERVPGLSDWVKMILFKLRELMGIKRKYITLKLRAASQDHPWIIQN
jgi:hypothetical protein